MVIDQGCVVNEEGTRFVVPWLLYFQLNHVVVASVRRDGPRMKDIFAKCYARTHLVNIC